MFYMLGDYGQLYVVFPLLTVGGSNPFFKSLMEGGQLIVLVEVVSV